LQKPQETPLQQDTSSLDVIQAVATALGLNFEFGHDTEEMQGLLVQKANEMRQEAERIVHDQEKAAQDLEQVRDSLSHDSMK